MSAPEEETREPDVPEALSGDPQGYRALVGFFGAEDGPTDVSENHDAYLGHDAEQEYLSYGFRLVPHHREPHPLLLHVTESVSFSCSQQAEPGPYPRQFRARRFESLPRLVLGKVREMRTNFSESVSQIGGERCLNVTVR